MVFGGGGLQRDERQGGRKTEQKKKWEQRHKTSVPADFSLGEERSAVKLPGVAVFTG